MAKLFCTASSSAFSGRGSEPSRSRVTSQATRINVTTFFNLQVQWRIYELGRLLSYLHVHVVDLHTCLLINYSSAGTSVHQAIGVENLPDTPVNINNTGWNHGGNYIFVACFQTSSSRYNNKLHVLITMFLFLLFWTVQIQYCMYMHVGTADVKITKLDHYVLT